MNTINFEQISYRILLSIGESTDLKKMLSTSLSAYMKELGCARGAVLLVSDGSLRESTLDLAFSIPRSIERHPSFQALYEELAHIGQIAGDELVRKAADGTYYVMGMGSHGLLVLFKAGGEIEDGLLKTLRPVNRRFGNACRTAIQTESFQKSGRRFMEMANMLPGIIMELDPEYRITFFNRQTQEIFKQVDSNEFRPRTVFDFFPAEEEPEVRLLLRRIETGESLVARDLWMENNRGDRFRVNLLISPIANRGQLTGFRGIATDITHRVKLEQELIQRDRILHAITLSTQELIKSADFDQALSESLMILGKAIGVDRVYCFVNYQDADGTIVTVSQKAEWSAENVVPQIDNPDLQNIPAGMVDLFLEPLSQRRPFVALVKDLVPSVTKELLDEQEILSILVLPVFVRERFWGFIGFDDCHGERTWGDVEQGLLGLFTVSVAETLERKGAEEQVKSLYDNILEDLDTAQTIQNYILPSWYSRQSPVAVASNYLPSEKVGGDLFDCIEIAEGRFALYAADISGHGVQAALIMTAVKSVIQMTVASEGSDLCPERVLTRLNAVLSGDLLYENYMTICFCYIDLQAMEIRVLNAGHPPLMLIDGSSGNIEFFTDSGDIPLGWFPDHHYREEHVATVPFTADHTVCLMTDGVFDCADGKGEFLGFERFAGMIAPAVARKESVIMPHCCFQEIMEAGFVHRSDDFTFLALKLDPAPAGAADHLMVRLDAKFSSLETLLADVEQFLSAAGLEEMVGVRTKLVVTEFFTNIVKHGYQGSGNDIVLVELRMSDRVEVIFRDRAAAWSLPPRKEYLPQFFEELNEHEALSGRGMQMIYSAVESSSRERFHRVNETRFIIAP